MPSDICFRVRQIPIHLTLKSLIQAIEEWFSKYELVSVRVDERRTTLVQCCYNPKFAKTGILHFDSEPPQALEHLGTNMTYDLEISPDYEILIDKDFYGLTQLYTPSTDIKLDIIALSGLNGHAYGSWASKPNNRGLKKMWLRHFFQEDRSDCRTMIYGYNSRLNEPGIHTLSDYSEILLEEIDKVRKGYEDRPVALIGHSFGGIIIADAIVKDKENPRRRGCLFRMAKAIVFFATPHRGILFDDIREMVGDGSPRLDLVHSIGRGQEAEDLLSFTRYVEEERFRIMSFTETMQTKKLKQDPVTKTWARSGPYYTVLERKSSILNLPRDYEEVFCAEGDHSTLVKFNNKLENTYTTILGRFSTLLDHIVQASGDHAEINSRLLIAVLDREYSLVSVLLTLGKADPTLPAKSTKDVRMLRLLSLYGAKSDLGEARPVMEIEMSRCEARPNGMEHGQIDDASNADRGKILAWLSRLEPEKDHERIQKKRHRNTGQWFLESTKVQKWREEDKMSLLWCYGNPGVGKSVLTSTLLEEITTQYKSEKAIGIAYFYFSYQATATQEPEDVFSIWIKQLCRRQDGLPNSLRTLYKECIDDDLKPKLSELEDLAQEVINTFQKVFVVIDALDECSKQHRNALVNYLVRLSSHSHCTVKFFIASRREVDIERILLTASFSTFPVEVTKVDEDIATYIIHELKHREQDLFKLDEALKGAIQTRLLAQSDGMFLWVKCQLDYIYEQPSKKDIMDALNSLPDTVAGTYERMFKRINSQAKSMKALAHRALCWLITSKRVLLVKELAVAVAIEPTADCAGVINHEDVYSEKTILTSCCGFITNECGTVRPIHFTVQEFLKDKLLEIHEGVTGDILVTTSLLKSLLITDFKCQFVASPRMFQREERKEWRMFEREEWWVSLKQTGFHNLLEYSCTFLNLHLNDLHPLSGSVLRLVKGLLEEGRGILRWVILEVFRSQGKESAGEMLAEMESRVNTEWCAVRYSNMHQLGNLGDQWLTVVQSEINQISMNQYMHPFGSGGGRGVRSLLRDKLNQRVTPLILLSSLNLLSLYFHLYSKPVDVMQLNEVLHQVVRNGSVSAVKELLNRGCDIEFSDAQKNTPLLTAVMNRREEVAIFLIAEGANVHRFDKSVRMPALYHAYKNGMINTTKALIDNGANANIYKSLGAVRKNYGIILLGAINQKDPVMIRALMVAGADVNVRGEIHSMTALTLAVDNKDLVMVKTLIEGGADVNILGEKCHMTVLALAVEQKDPVMVKTLIEGGADVNVWGRNHSTVLREAIYEQGPREIVQALKEAGAITKVQIGRCDINILTSTASRPRACIEAVRALLGAGAQVINRGGRSGAVLQATIGNCRSIESIEILLKTRATLKIRGGNYARGIALFEAVGWDSPVIIKAIIKAGADVNTQGGKNVTALYAAIALDRSIETVKVLLQAGADINIQGGKNGTALRAAIVLGRPIEIIRALLESGADINIQSGCYGTALQAAACKGPAETIKALLDAGADVNIQGGKTGTALQAAIMLDRPIEIIKVLLQAGANINIQGGKNGTALRAAIMLDRPMEIIKALLEAGADVNLPSGRNGTALQAAVGLGRSIDIIEELLKSAANVNIQGGIYGTALHAAIVTGRSIKTIEALLEAGADVNIQSGYYGTALFEAIRQNSIAVVKAIIEAGADVNIKYCEYGTALHEAITRGHSIEIVKTLLDAGADADIQGGKNGTAIHTAIVLGRPIEMIRALLESGADINIQSGCYGTALQTAACKGSAETIKALLDAGADANIQGGKTGTALQAAIMLDRPIEIIKVLLQAGTNINIQGGKNGTALQAAIALGRPMEIIKALLEAGADVKIQGGIHGTALHAAIVQDRSIEDVKALLEAGADVNTQGNSYYGTALQLAASNGAVEIVKVLIEAGANVNIKGGRYGTALRAAARCGSAAVVKALLKAGAHDNIQDDLYYGTALQLAASNGAIETVKVLIESGANVNIKSSMCGTALQVAYASYQPGGKGIVKILLEAGAIDVNCNESH